MVEIELRASVKTSNYLKTHLDKITKIMGPDYSISEYRIDDIRQRLFIYVDAIHIETKKKWFSKKTYQVNKLKRVCWMCYQKNYGIYIFPSLIEESKKLAELLEKNGYKVIIFVDDEKYLTNE